MAYYEGDSNQQNGQDFNQQPQGQPNPGAAQPENQFNQNASQTQGQQFQQQANQGQQFQQNQQFNQGQPNYQQSYNQPVNNYVDTGHSPVQIMVFGIVSLASSVLFSYTVILGVLSIVFGALAMSWSKKFNEANPGNNDGQVKAGRVCGIIGLIAGIVGMVVGLIVFLTVGCAACFASMGGYGY
ncbi:MAG: hypothetical protein K5644_03490 [Lachnospiraceae bacterium]|nr:hypothetical protein [Lachnospiraceae bacterium]